MFAAIRQLHVVDGEVKAARPIPGLFIETAPRSARRGRERDTLLLHVTVSGPADEARRLQMSIVDTFQQTYYQTPGGVTTALRRAVNTANQHLLEHNLNDSPAAMRTGALCGAVLRGDELHLIQVGEAQAYIGHNFGLEAVPAIRTKRLTPLGEQSGVDVQMFHTWMQEGENLLLLDPRLLHVEPDLFAPILVNQHLDDAADQLQHLLRNNSARLIVAQVSAGSASIVEQTTVVQPEQMVREPAVMTVKGKSVERREGEVEKEEEAIRVRRRQMSDSQVMQVERDPAVVRTQRGRVSPVEKTARNGCAAVLFGLSDGVRGFARVLSRFNQVGKSSAAERWTALAVAVIVPLIVGSIVAGSWLQRERVTVMAMIKQDIGTAWERSQRVDDNSLRRDYYDYILYQTDLATSYQSNDVEIDTWRRRVQSQLDEEEGTIHLAAAPLLEFGSRSDLQSLVLGEPPDHGIYVLDGAKDAVYFAPTNEDYRVSAKADTLIAGQEPVGTHIIEDIIDISWRQASGREGIALLDQSGALITQFVDRGDRNNLPLGLASNWIEPVKLVDYAERVYVLDRGNAADNARIWRYLPQTTGMVLDSENPSIKLPDLHQAVDFVINEDGTVIVLYQDGRVRRYATAGNVTTIWDEESLVENGLSEPLVSPQAVYVTGSGFQSAIYVLDPGSSRLVKISIGGTVLAQYRSRTFDGTLDVFANTRDFVVEDAPFRVYALTENAVYIVTP